MAHKYIYADENSQHEGQADIYFYIIQETELKLTETGKTEQTGIFSKYISSISWNWKTVNLET